MLNILKQDLVKKELAISPVEMITESVANDDIRDAFLDSSEAILLGVENDTKIAKQVEDIPESNDFELTDDEMEELKGLEESLSEIPEEE